MANASNEVAGTGVVLGAVQGAEPITKPLPVWVKLTRMALPSTFIELYMGPEDTKSFSP